MTAQAGQKRPVAHCAVVTVRMLPELQNGISAAATKRQMSVSGWLRNAAMTTLMLEGIDTLVVFPDVIDEPGESA